MIGGGQTIYTLGTSTRSESEFIHLLKGSEIQIVVDVHLPNKLSPREPPNSSL